MHSLVYLFVSKDIIIHKKEFHVIPPIKYEFIM